MASEAVNLDLSSHQDGENHRDEISRSIQTWMVEGWLIPDPGLSSGRSPVHCSTISDIAGMAWVPIALRIPRQELFCPTFCLGLFSWLGRYLRKSACTCMLGASIHSLPNLCFSGCIIMSLYPLRTTLQCVAQFQLVE